MCYTPKLFIITVIALSMMCVMWSRIILCGLLPFSGDNVSLRCWEEQSVNHAGALKLTLGQLWGSNNKGFFLSQDLKEPAANIRVHETVSVRRSLKSCWLRTSSRGNAALQKPPFRLQFSTHKEVWKIKKSPEAGSSINYSSSLAVRLTVTILRHDDSPRHILTFSRTVGVFVWISALELN